MTLLAVKTYVAQTAKQVSMQGLPWSQITIYDQFPKLDPDGFSCVATVGEVRRNSKRRAGARGQGTVIRPYRVILLLTANLTDDQKGGRGFDILIERMCDLFLAANPAAFDLTDPVTRQTSRLYSIGEDIDVQVLTPDTGDDTPATLVNFRAALTLELTETVQPA